MRDRFLAFVARLLTSAFFRSVERVGTVDAHGPVILAASHQNGLVDPVLLVAELGVLPRFLAKATLWRRRAVRPLLRFARLIPVHRREDAPGIGEADNTAMFRDAVGALGEGRAIAIFPEGTTHDDPSIRPLRTGAARIALDAVASGVDRVDIVPVGVSYQDKVAVRDRAVVAFGPPITVGAGDVPIRDGDRHAAVRELTARLDAALRELTPDFASFDDAVALNTAARIVETTEAQGRRPSAAREMDLAKRFARRDRATVDRVVAAVARYALLLGFVRLRDGDVAAGTGLRSITRRAAGLALLLVVLAPFAAAGLVANVVPAAIVVVAGLLPRAPVSKGTVRLLVALVVFPLTWAAIATWDAGDGWFARTARAATAPAEPVFDALFGGRGGIGANVVAFVAVPLFGAVALVLVERSQALVRDLFVWRTLVDRRGQLPSVHAARDDVVAVSRAALAGEELP